MANKSPKPPPTLPAPPPPPKSASPADSRRQSKSGFPPPPPQNPQTPVDQRRQSKSPQITPQPSLSNHQTPQPSPQPPPISASPDTRRQSKSPQITPQPSLSNPQTPQPSQQPQPRSESPDTRRQSKSPSNAPPSPQAPASERQSRTSIAADSRRQSVSPSNTKGQAPAPPIAGKSGPSGRSQLKGPKFKFEDTYGASPTALIQTNLEQLKKKFPGDLNIFSPDVGQGNIDKIKKRNKVKSDTVGEFVRIWMAVKDVDKVMSITNKFIAAVPELFPRNEEINNPELLSFAEILAQTIITSGHITDEPGYAPIGFEQRRFCWEHVQQVYTNDVKQFSENGASNFSCHSLPDQWDSSKTVNIPTNSWDFISTLREQRSVHIMGRSGIGKTTACHWMNYKWAQGVYMVPMCMLFMLDVKDLMLIKEPVTLTQLLLNYSVYSVGGEHPKLHKWLQDHSKFITFFIDGAEVLLNLINDFPSAQKCTAADPNLKAPPITWLMNIMNSTALPASTKYVFSVCHTKMVSQCMKALMKARFTMYGFSKENIEEFVKRNRSPEQAELILTIMKANPLMMIYAQIPYFANLLCTILQHETVVDNFNIETYSQLFAFLIMKLANTDQPTVSDPGDLGQKLQLLLPFLMLAYSKINPYKNEFPCSVFTLAEMTQCGINPTTDNIIMRSGIFTVRKYKDAVYGRFCNYSIQEVFGALFLLVQKGDVLKNAFKRLVESLEYNMLRLLVVGYGYDDSQWSKTLRNCCGGESAVGEPIKNYVDKIISKDPMNNKSGWLPLKVAFEAQNDKFAQQLAKKLHIDKEKHSFMISEADGPFTTYDMMALPSVLQHVKELETIWINSLGVESSATINLFKFIDGRKTIENLNLAYNCRIDDDIVPYIMPIITNFTLRFLKLTYTEMTNGAILRLLPRILRAGDTRPSICFDYRLLLNKLASVPPLPEIISLVGGPTSHVQKKIKDEALKGILELCSLGFGASLRELSFQYQQITDVGVGYLSDAFSKGLSLRLLRLEGNQITDEGVAKLVRALEKNTTLSFLGLGSLLTDKGAEMIVGLVKNKPKLTKLYLHGNKFTDKGHELLIDLLKGQVVRIDVEHNPISEKCYKRLGAVMKGSNTTCLMLKETGMTETSLSYIVDSLKGHKALTMLHLSDVNDGGAEKLIAALHDNKTLTNLALHYSPICADLCMRLAHFCFLREPKLEISSEKKNVMWSLTHFPTWQTRNFNRMELTDVGMEYLVPLILHAAYIERVERLNLCRNNITAKGISILRQSLWRTQVINRVSMRFNNFGDAGCIAWADILTNNRTLEHIAIEENGVTDKGLQEMLNMLSRNSCLVSLNLGFNAGMTIPMVTKFLDYFKSKDSNKTLLNISFDGHGKEVQFEKVVRELQNYLHNRPGAKCIAPQSLPSRPPSPDDENYDAYLTNPKMLMGHGGFMGY